MLAGLTHIRAKPRFPCLAAPYSPTPSHLRGFRQGHPISNDFLLVHTNPLACFALTAEAQHSTSRVGCRSGRRAVRVPGGNYNNVAANPIRASAHAFEAKSFGLVTGGSSTGYAQCARGARYPCRSGNELEAAQASISTRAQVCRTAPLLMLRLHLVDLGYLPRAVSPRPVA